MHKRVGTILGTPIYEDPNMPPGIIYMLHDHFQDGATHPNCNGCQIVIYGRWKRILLSLKRWYNSAMKKYLLPVVAVVAILVCLGYAVSVTNTRHKSTVDPQVAKLQSQLTVANTTLAQHDSVANAHANDLAGQITTLTTQKATLCAQIKAARLVQPICQ